MCITSIKVISLDNNKLTNLYMHLNYISLLCKYVVAFLVHYIHINTHTDFEIND